MRRLEVTMFQSRWDKVPKRNHDDMILRECHLQDNSGCWKSEVNWEHNKKSESRRECDRENSTPPQIDWLIYDSKGLERIC